MDHSSSDGDLGEGAVVVVVGASHALVRDLRRLLQHAQEHVEPDDRSRSPGPAAGSDGSASTLTPREIEVLRLVARGRSNHQIAQSLWVSQDTVRFHLRNAYRKLGVHSRRAAVAAALDDPPDERE